MSIKLASNAECEQVFRDRFKRDSGNRFPQPSRYDRYKRRHVPRMITFVRANTAQASATVTVTPPTATTSGNLLVLLTAQTASSAATVTITDTASQTWTQSASGYSGDGGWPMKSAVWYKANSASVTSVTANWGVAAVNYMTLVEISGCVLSSPEDASVNAQTLANTTTSTSGNLTTTNANDILLHMVSAGATVTAFTAGSGFTLPSGGTGNITCATYQIVSSTQTGFNTTTTWTTSTHSTSVLIAFIGIATGAAFQDDGYSLTQGGVPDSNISVW